MPVSASSFWLTLDVHINYTKCLAESHALSDTTSCGVALHSSSPNRVPAWTNVWRSGNLAWDMMFAILAIAHFDKAAINGHVGLLLLIVLGIWRLLIQLLQSIYRTVILNGPGDGELLHTAWSGVFTISIEWQYNTVEAIRDTKIYDIKARDLKCKPSMRDSLQGMRVSQTIWSLYLASWTIVAEGKASQF